MEQNISLFALIFITLFGVSQSMDNPLALDIITMGNVNPIHEFKASDAEIMSLALSLKEDFIVVGAGNSTGGKKVSGVSIWKNNEWNNLTNNNELLLDHKIDSPDFKDYSTQSLAVSIDGKTIIGQSDDFVWKSDKDNKELVDFGEKFFPPIDSLRIQRSRIVPDKNLIIINQDIRSLGITGYSYISANIYNLDSGELLKSLQGAHGHLADLAVNPEGTLVGGIVNDGSAVVWDVEKGKIVKEFNIKSGWFGRHAEKSQLITVMDISNSYIATYGMNDEIKLIKSSDFNDVKSWKMTSMQDSTIKDSNNYHPTTQISRLKISPNEQYIIFRTNVGGWMGIIDIKSNKIVRFKISSLSGSAEWPSIFIVSNDSKNIIVGNSDGVVRIFDIKKIVENEPTEKPVLDLAMAKNSLTHLTATLGSLVSK